MKAKRFLTWLTVILLIGVQACASAPVETEETRLRRYAQDTWASFVALAYEATGLPDDNICFEGGEAGLGGYTSPTNIATYLWSTIAARDLGMISATETSQRIAATLTSLERMERAHGLYFNWYDPATGDTLTTWPADDGPVRPFLSTVDNGWLTMALMIVSRAAPEFADRATALAAAMNYGFFYDPEVGQLRGGYWTDTDEYTGHHYGTLNTEPRISSYIGIAAGDLPASHYYRMFRTFPPDWDWQEQRPLGDWASYGDVSLFQGRYPYRGLEVVPSWGGSMFEALMVPLFVPEAEWGPDSWGINHPRYVQAHIEHGMNEAQYGYWGFSPSNNPAGGYREYGVEAIGMNPDGYTSNNDDTHVEYGYEGNEDRPPQPLPGPEDYTNGVVTPHAVFLALAFAPEEALANLANLERDFDAYTSTGFYDAINVSTGEVARCHLALDQGMIMAAVANRLLNNLFHRYFGPEIEAQVRPLLEAESFFPEN